MSENRRNKGEGEAIEVEVGAEARGQGECCKWHRSRHVVKKCSVPLTEKVELLVLDNKS